MRLLGVAVVALGMVVLVVGTLSTIWEWRRDRHVARYRANVKYLPLVASAQAVKQVK